MRVVHLTAGNQFGGVDRLLTALMTSSSRPSGELPGEGEGHFQSSVALCFEGKLAEALRAAGTDPFMLGSARMSRPWTLRAPRRRLECLLDELRPDVVITHGSWMHGLFAPLVRRGGLPLVFWAHEVMSGRHWLEKRAARTAPDRILVGSSAVREGAKRVFGSVATSLLRCAVASPDLGDRATVRSEIRRTLETSNDEVVIAMACRMDPIKGHLPLLEALDQLVKMADLPKWQCWIAGEPHGPAGLRYKKQLQSRVEALGLNERVKFLGYRDDIPRLLAASDIYCQPNVGPEAFGIAFIEAMDAALPVVTSAIGGALEIVDSECGLLLPPGDIPALTEGLRGLIENEPLRRRLGVRSGARARQLCDPAARMLELEQILQGMLNALSPGDSRDGHSPQRAQAVPEQGKTCGSFPR